MLNKNDDELLVKNTLCRFHEPILNILQIQSNHILNQCCHKLSMAAFMG